MPDRLTAVPRASLADQVVDRLRAAIETGQLAPGQRLIEAELAGQLGVSRAPLREALRELQKEGVVENAPGRGSHVITITADVVVEIYALRLAVESIAVQRCAEQAGQLDLTGLAEWLNGVRPEMAAADLVRHDLDFHEQLCALAGYPRLQSMFKGLRCLTGLALSQFGITAHNPELVGREHRNLLEAVAAGETEAALRLLQAHLVGGRDDLLAVLNTSVRAGASDT